MFNLPGCNFGTSQGNWMNVPFDMTDIDANNAPGLAGAYAISFFPTLYVVSPDNRIYQIRQRTFSEYESWLIHSFKLDATGTPFNAVCGGDGGVNMSVSGGYGNLTYRWSNGARTKDLNGVGGGSYSVTVTDQNGYDKVFGPFNVTGPSVPLAVTPLAKSNVKCNGVPDGSISVAGNGGTPGYQYEWNNGETTPSISNLAAGTYTVTITDLNGCTDVESFTITEPDPLTVNTYVYPENCLQGDGKIEAFGFGGTPPYTYSIGGPPSPNNIFTGLNFGVYTLQTFDKNNCMTTEIVLVDPVPGPLVVVGDDETLGCGVDSLFLSGQGSQQGPSISYEWTTADGNILRGANTLEPEVDEAGTYILHVIDDATGCISIDSLEVSMDTSVIARPGADTLVNCAHPEITLDGSESTMGPDIIYEWVTEDGNIVSGANTLNPLIDAPGTYALVALDTVTMCFDTTSLEVTEDIAAPYTEIVPPATIDCENRVITLDGSPSSNGPEFSILWTTTNGNIVSGEQTLMPEVDAAGTYTLHILNQINGCESSSTVTVQEDINEPSSEFGYAIDTLSVQFTDKSAGTPSAWSWDFGDGNTSVEQNPVHTYGQPGKYTACLTITNECGTDVTCEEFQVGFGLILSSYILGNVSCNGGANGKIDITVQGGVAPYTYLWNTGSTDEDLFDIPAGQYSVTVTDAVGAQVTLNVEVKQPTAIELEDAIVTPSTGTMNNGSIALTVAGGVQPYEYNWDNGATGATINGLEPGEYTCVVVDGNGCEMTFGPFVVGTVNSTNGFQALNEFKIFPNPAADVLNFSISYSAALETDIRLISTTGSVLQKWSWTGQQGDISVDVSHVASGVYFVYLTTKEGTVSRLVTINH